MSCENKEKIVEARAEQAVAEAEKNRAEARKLSAEAEEAEYKAEVAKLERDKVMEKEEQRKADEGKAALASELQELLSAFIDSAVLRGKVVTKKQWERACLLCGRWCPPFVDHQLEDNES